MEAILKFLRMGWVSIFLINSVLCMQSSWSATVPPEENHINLTNLSESDYQYLMSQIKENHQTGVIGGGALILIGIGAISFVGHRHYSKNKCAMSMLNTFRLGSSALLSTAGGLYVLEFTRLSYNRQKLFLTNFKKVTSPSDTKQVETLGQLVQELFPNKSAFLKLSTERRAQLNYILDHKGFLNP
jgi:hypothetical protein